MREKVAGKYRLRMAQTAADVTAAQTLRHRAFRGGADGAGLDADPYDALCDHILIETQEAGKLVACFRLMCLPDGAALHTSYSAQFYDLSPLSDFDGPMVEMGRFCLAPEVHDPDILRLAWGELTAYVDEIGIKLLFGCSSFRGTDALPYHDAFALLRDRHIAPARWRPQIKSSHVFPFAAKLRLKPDLKRAMATLPPLLRSYLMLGGWVSDHAVIDQDLNTLHVFTGLEIAAVPPARARLLRLAR
ncbi:GNAT family N-acetyltransferase [Rhodobacterales bacterium HKCCD6035]|nr:GNAT family N-acetyltransferase [Rhodobacterales bacterium HKCCD6035]